MSRRASRSSAVVLLLALAACQTSAPAPRSIDPNAEVVIPYAVSGGGEVRFTVHPRYTVADPVSFTLDIRAGTQEIRGPLSGRVLASELSSGEQLIRTLGPTGLGGVDVTPGQTARSTVTWDGRDEKGDLVSAQTYSLSLDFVVGDQAQRLGTVIEIRPR